MEKNGNTPTSLLLLEFLILYLKDIQHLFHFYKFYLQFFFYLSFNFMDLFVYFLYLRREEEARVAIFISTSY
jgi:hypothetical protein